MGAGGHVRDKDGTFAAMLVAGKGSLGAVRTASWWHLLGGLMGAMFVVTSLLCVPRIGMTALIVAAVAGQVTMAVLIDRFALLGVVPRGLDLRRIVGLVLVAAGVLLVNWKTPENAVG